jgi:hypothetical protein
MPEKPVKAFIVINRTWTRECGFSEIFRPTPDNPNAIISIVPASAYNLEDNVFVEIEFFPAKLEGRWVKFFVPKSQVVNILIVQDKKDAKDGLGFDTSAALIPGRE